MFLLWQLCLGLILVLIDIAASLVVFLKAILQRRRNKSFSFLFSVNLIKLLWYYQQASKIWLSKIPLFKELISYDNPMCKKQKHIDILEKFYTNIVEALKRAASEVLTNSPKQKHNVLGWNKMWEKSTRLSDKHTYTELTIINPKVDLYLTSWKQVKTSSNMH